MRNRDLGVYLMRFLTDHIRDTDIPQSYLQHGWFAFQNSIWMIVAGVIGIIHAVFPWWFRFYTAEKIVKLYVSVSISGRHDPLLEKFGLR